MMPKGNAAQLEEKRNFVRAPIRVLVHTQHEARLTVGESINLSGGGMLVETGLPLSLGDRLLTKFALSKIPHSILAQARVAHVTRRKEGSRERLQVGLQFLELAASTVAAIDDACVSYLMSHDREALKLVKRPVATAAEPHVAATCPKPPDVSLRASNGELHVQVRFGTEEEFLGEYLRNIAKNGITIDAAEELPTFAEVVVDLQMPRTDEVLRLQGVAVHRFGTGSKSRKRVGVHLCKPKSPGLTRVHQLAAQMLASRRSMILDQAA